MHQDNVYPVLYDWCKNISKTLMLNCHLIHLLAWSYPRWFLAVSKLQEASLWSVFRVKNEVINVIHTFSNCHPHAEFEKTIKVKWAEIMELGITNEVRYFEKVWTKKTDCESEDSDE